MAKVVRKKTVKKPVGKTEVLSDPNREWDKVENWEVTEKKKPVPKEKAKRVQKVVSLHISIGDSDRKRSLDDFIKHIHKALKVVPYGQDGVHLTEMGAYYLLDGLVCLKNDYDPVRETFKEGSAPPSWAGGPPPKPRAADDVSGGKWERTSISAKEWDKKYPNGNPHKVLPPDPDAGLEELDWDSELDNVEEHEEIAEETTQAMRKALKIKKTVTPAKKRVVRKVKK